MIESGVREIRINPVVPGESVLVATARSMRSNSAEGLALRDTRKRADTCPSRRGNEDRTPPPIFQSPEGGAERERRLVPNRHPVPGDDRLDMNVTFGLRQSLDGYGRHEVFADHPDQGAANHEGSVAHLAVVVGADRERVPQLFESDRRLTCVLVFKNLGPAAEASIPHSHGQIVAMAVVPENVVGEVEISAAYHARHQHCIPWALSDQGLTFEATTDDKISGAIRRKINVGQYVVERGRRFIAIKLLASGHEWEFHIMPQTHQGDFGPTEEADLEDRARVMKNTMARLDAVIGAAPYDFFLHSAPRDGREHAAGSYGRIEICPRSSIPTGFELRSGLFVNTPGPDAAALKLRRKDLRDEAR